MRTQIHVWASDVKPPLCFPERVSLFKSQLQHNPWGHPLLSVFLSTLSVSSCPRLRLLLHVHENRTQQLQPSIQSSSILFSQPCPHWAGLLWNLTEGALFLPLPIYMVNILKIQPSLSKLSLEDILSRRSPKTQPCPALTHVCTVVFPAAPRILREECSLHTWLALPGKQNWFFSDTKDCHRWSLLWCLQTLRVTASDCERWE